VTVLEIALPKPEEQEREPPQGKGTEEEEDILECPNHHPSTYIEGKPRSIIRLPLFLLSCPAVN